MIWCAPPGPGRRDGGCSEYGDNDEESVGRWTKRVTANTYSHVLVDETELDYSALLMSV
jgi:hypothetical protein